MMTATAIGVGIGLILGTLLIFWIRRTKKKLQEEKFQASRKVREDALKEALANNLDPAADPASASPYRPYKVNYSTGENQENGEKLPLLQIVEKNKLSEKKYIFRASETVTLGIQFGSACVLNRMESGESWCELFFQKTGYCVRVLGEHPVSVKRKKHTAIIDKLGIRLKSGDIIKIQETAFQVFYVKG